MARFTRVLLAMILVGALAGCTGSGNAAPTVPVGATARTTTFLTIGSSATEGDGVRDRFHEAWPYLVFDQAFPISADLVNAAVDGATVANARAQQVPIAGELKVDVVAIWLGVDDLAQHTPIRGLAPELERLIQDVRSAGAQRILVADVPSVFGKGAARYNAAIRQAVRATNATLVELERAAITLAPTRGLPDQPDAASQRVIALAFERSLKQGA